MCGVLPSRAGTRPVRGHQRKPKETPHLGPGPESATPLEPKSSQPLRRRLVRVANQVQSPLELSLYSRGIRGLSCASPSRPTTSDSRRWCGPHPSQPSPLMMQVELDHPATLRVGLWIMKHRALTQVPGARVECRIGPGSWARVPRVHRDEYRRTQSNSVPSAGPTYPV